jgi:hypothetical protein
VYAALQNAGSGYALNAVNPSSEGFAGYFNGNVNVVTDWSYCYGGTCSPNSGGVTGACIGGGCASDERLKQNIQPLAGSLERLAKLRPVTFQWKANGDNSATYTGFIAQEVEKVFPRWVENRKDGYKSIVLTPLEVAALEVGSLRELKERAETAEARVDKQQGQIDKQQAQLDKQQEEIDRILHGRDPISQGPGFGSGMLALFAAGFAGATGLMLKRMGLSLATVVGLLIAGRKKDEETKS